MKAISCPQCGSSISKISGRQPIVQCDYCDAKIMIPRGFVPNDAEAKPELINQFGYPLDRYVPFDETRISNSSIKTTVIALFLVFGIGFVILLVFAANSKSRFATTLPKPTPYKTPNITPPTTPTPYRTPTPHNLSKGKTISGGVLNEKAIDLPKPAYPQLARIIKADSGAVNVQVTVDENGNVISTSAVSGHPVFWQEAEQAARSAKFAPTLLRGKPVRVAGVIVYNFIPEQ